jgi:magnesium-transporting ATPase (P-type)
MRTGLVSLLMLSGAYWLFFHELAAAGASTAAARTAVIDVIVVVETGYLFNCRSLAGPAFSASFFANPWAFAGSAAMIALQLLFTYAPFMNRWFHTAPISAGTWMHILALAGGIFAVVEAEKWLRYGRGQAGRLPPE